MRFAYYARLGRKDKAIYDRSDAIPGIRLPQPSLLWPVIPILRSALDGDDKRAVQAACNVLARGIADMLGIEAVEVQVLAVRPTLSSAELHGLYTREPGRVPRVRVWMRTVRHRRVVAFKTFLRTLLHELCHHLDYTHLGLAESFHTEGFFKRESSLFHQLVTDASPGRGGRQPADGDGGRL
jgi:hypothetical protein